MNDNMRNDNRGGKSKGAEGSGVNGVNKSGGRPKDRVLTTEARIVSWGTAVGGAEHSGPLGDGFDLWDKDDRFGQETWEQAESEMQKIALSVAVKRSGRDPSSLGAIFAGDLLNQCVGSAYGLLDYHSPYFGLYGACSTSAEGILLASMAVSAGYFDLCAAVTSSHNCSAERQFRTPIEYGGQKPPSAQWTVTGAGAFIIGSEEEFSSVCPIKVAGALPGIVTDKGITDPNNMGAAMAPAAASTILRYFDLTGGAPEDHDMILTGDLGQVGSEILLELLMGEGLDLSEVHRDCGLMIYEGIEHPDVNSGGSGCGCAASVMGGSILPRMASGELKNVLFLATGAMMSPSSLQQGLTIPSVAHLINLKYDNI